jgi:CheY-like chemotaxis protein
VNQKVLQRQLEQLGFGVHVANHGREALDILRKSKFWYQNSPTDHTAPSKALLDLTIVLMDQEMPVMDGMECTKAIRRMEAQRQFVEHVPIIGVTANARTEQIEALMDAGMVSLFPDTLYIIFADYDYVGRCRFQAFPYS